MQPAEFIVSLVDLVGRHGCTMEDIFALFHAQDQPCLLYTSNKNTIPNDPQSPFVTSGIRLGTAAVTTRGFNEADLDMVADAIAMIIADPEGNKAKATEIVKGLTDRYPLYE